MMAIAYHNVAVEQEYLKKFDLAIQSYRKAPANPGKTKKEEKRKLTHILAGQALEIAEKHLGPDQGITQVLQDVTTKARQENILRTRSASPPQRTFSSTV